MKKAFVISALIILTLAGCSNASSAESTTEPVSQKFSPFSPTQDGVAGGMTKECFSKARRWVSILAFA